MITLAHVKDSFFALAIIAGKKSQLESTYREEVVRKLISTVCLGDKPSIKVVSDQLFVIESVLPAKQRLDPNFTVPRLREYARNYLIKNPDLVPEFEAAVGHCYWNIIKESLHNED